MVEMIDEDTGALILQVKRALHGKTWWFELEIPYEYWQDIFRVTDDHGPQNASAAYAYAQGFWDTLADENANMLERETKPGAGSRHIRNLWPDYISLEAAYSKHRR